MKPALGQRWLFSNLQASYVAEVVQTNSVLKCKILQVIRYPLDKDPEITLGGVIEPVTLGPDGPMLNWWNYLEGQDGPR